MLKLLNYQKIILSFLASLTLLLIGLAILGISLFATNRQQSGLIQLYSP